MPEISPERSLREITTLSDRAQKARQDADPDLELAALQGLATHPCARHQVDVPGVWDEIHHLHKRGGRFDEAIDAKREAVRLGYRSAPHPDADIAACLLLAGRRAEADELFADIRARTPEDVWLRTSAGFAYEDANDLVEAARWFREGIDLALRSGDPEQVVQQLLGSLQEAERALGRPPEPGLAERVDAFTHTWTRPRNSRPPSWGGEAPPEVWPCPHCGESTDVWDDDPLPRSGRGQGKTIVALAWFEPGAWQQACALWPHLLDGNPADHTEYSHSMEARLKRQSRTAGRGIRVSPISVTALTAFCEEHGDDPGSAEGRAYYAAEIARLGKALTWPPGRNAPCWCGSGRKYKVCCGPVRPLPE